jgi:hypothetical protein
VPELIAFLSRHAQLPVAESWGHFRIMVAYGVFSAEPPNSRGTPTAEVLKLELGTVCL